MFYVHYSSEYLHVSTCVLDLESQETWLCVWKSIQHCNIHYTLQYTFHLEIYCPILQYSSAVSKQCKRSVQGSAVQCTSEHYTAFHCIALHCTAGDPIVSEGGSRLGNRVTATGFCYWACVQYPVQYCTVLVYNVLDSTTIYFCTIQFTELRCTYVQYIVQHCTVRVYIILYSTALYFGTINFIALHFTYFCTAQYLCAINCRARKCTCV